MGTWHLADEHGCKHALANGLAKPAHLLLKNI
jgi:hypothetical protein